MTFFFSHGRENERTNGSRVVSSRPSRRSVETRRGRGTVEGSTSLAKGQPRKNRDVARRGPLEGNSGFAEGSRSLVNGSPLLHHHPSTILISSSLSPGRHMAALYSGLRAASLAGQTSPAHYRPSAARNMYRLREDGARCSSRSSKTLFRLIRKNHWREISIFFILLF